MAFLNRQLKSVLLLLAAELDVNVTDKLSAKKIIDAIKSAPDYEENLAKDFLQRISEKLELEKQRKEQEYLKAERERKAERQFELEKLKLRVSRKIVNVASTGSAQESVTKKSNLMDLVPKFDPKQIDVSLFFTIFERQVKREGLDEKDWVSELIPLLPPDEAQIVVKIKESKADDYQHVKQVMFNRFKLSARALRNKFENHVKKSNDLWVDLVYELRGYLENWLETLKIDKFDSLKELILTEQIKKRVPAEIKQYFANVWEEVNRATELAEKFDKFEVVRTENGKCEPTPFDSSSYKKIYQRRENNAEAENKGRSGAGKPEKREVQGPKVKNVGNNVSHFVRPSELNQGYYILRNQTFELIKTQQKEINPVNDVSCSPTREIEAPRFSKTELGDKIERENVFREKMRGCGILQANSSEQESVSLVNDKGEEKSIPDDAKMLIQENCSVIPFLNKEEKSSLVNVSAEGVSRGPKTCSSLQELRGKTKEKNEKVFKIEKGRFGKISESKNCQNRVELCASKKNRMEMMSLRYDEIAGLLDSCRTKDRVLTNFFWPNCYQQIEEYVRTCLVCQKVGKPRDKQKAPLRLVPIISEVFRRLSIDAIGPMITSSRNNRYAITAVCVASKFPDAIPIENLSSKSVIHALIQIFSKTGFPREIVCDQGTCFTSELTTAFFDKYNIKVSHTSVCHPQSNPVERLHSTLKRILKTLCLESKGDWEENLPMALFALRTMMHESIGFSPTELLFGRNLRMPHTIVYENWMQAEELSQNVVDYILDLNARLKKCQELAVERMTECQKKRKLWYDRNAVTRKFKVGDQVLVLATAKPHKMAVQWLGPGVVTGVISETNYTVNLPERRSTDTIFHVNLMKPYHKRPEYVNLIIEGGGEEIEDEACIPYPVSDPNHFDLRELTRDGKLGKGVLEENLGTFQNLLVRHKKVFSNDPGSTPLIEMDIILTDERPIRSRPYRMSPRQLEIMKREIQRLLDLGVIEVGQSDYASPMILVECPGKDPRPCIDYRALNARTQVEFFPLPNIEEVVEKVSGASFISVMDLTKGYFQIPLTKRAQRYAAFVTPFGEFIPRRMMFGLLNAPFYFCKLISSVLGDLSDYALPYIDDIAVFSPNWESHLKHLDEVLRRLEKANLKVKPAKCMFAQDHVRFLGHEVGSGKRFPSEAKIKTIQDFPIPKTKTQLRSFLGLTGFYYRYICGYASKAAPLTDLLKGKNRKEKIEWSEESDQAFKGLKEELTRSPVLYSPDFTKEFIVQTDASLVGAGVILAQKFENEEEHPIVYLSKKFTRAERNYSTTERELAAIIFGVKKLNHYLDGQKFVLQTDHNPLVYLKKMMGSNSRLTRWALCLQQYNFTVVHKSGKKHSNADALSRIYEE